MNRLTDPHPQDEHCKAADLDHCLSHGVDEPEAGAYRICLECGHVFPGAAALLADHAALVERLNTTPTPPPLAPPSGLFGGPMATETDPERVRFCAHCGHDF